jgi:hypothetical protein
MNSAVVKRTDVLGQPKMTAGLFTFSSVWKCSLLAKKKKKLVYGHLIVFGHELGTQIDAPKDLHIRKVQG